MKTAFTIFLLVYSYIKYTAVPSQMGEPMYMATTALVVILTAVIPFFIARHLLAKASPPKSYVLAAFVPLALSAIGLAIYFYMFYSANRTRHGSDSSATTRDCARLSHVSHSIDTDDYA